MFKYFSLIILFIAAIPQTSFSQLGQYVAFTKDFTTVEEMCSSNMLIIDIVSEENLKGTYYECKNKNWEISGSFTAGRSKNSFKGEAKINGNASSIEGSFSGDDNITVGSYKGYLTPYVAGTYFVNGNKSKVVKITQDGPFLEVTDENNETSKGVICGETMFLMIAWDRIGIVGDKGQISVKDGVDWIKE